MAPKWNNCCKAFLIFCDRNEAIISSDYMNRKVKRVNIKTLSQTSSEGGSMKSNFKISLIPIAIKCNITLAKLQR